MRRLAALALMLLPAAARAGDAPAPPAPPAPAAPVAPEKRRVLNIRDFAPTPLPPGYDWSRAVQAAIDFVGSVPNPYGVVRYTLEIDDVYNCFRPIVADAPNMAFVGTTPGASLIWFHQAGPGILVGANRKAAGGVPGDLRPDSFGKLDASAAPRPGVVRGLATRSAARPGYNAHATLGGTAFAIGRGDGYESTRKLTVEFAFEPGGVTGDGWAAFADHKPLLGGAGDTGNGGPVRVLFQNGKPGWYWFTFATSDGVGRAFLIPVSDDGTRPAGTQHVAGVIDLDAGTVAGYRNRQQVKVVEQLGAGWKPGLSFQPNENSAFGVGSASFWATDAGIGRADSGSWTCHGLRLSDAAIYAADGPGTPQRRLDGKPVNDFNSYLLMEPAAFALLRLDYQDNDPNWVQIAQRDLAGSLAAFGFAPVLPDTGMGVYAAGGSGLRFKDLSLVNSADANHGAAMACLEARGLTLENLTLRGGAFGFMAHNSSFNSYPIVARELYLHGQFAAWYGMGQNLRCNGLSVDYCGRYGLLLAGSAATIDGGFWTQCMLDGTRALIRCKGGSNANLLVVRDVAVDQENVIRGARAVVWVDNGQPQHRVHLERFDVWAVGTTSPANPAGIPFLLLDGSTGTSGTARVVDCYEAPWSSMVCVANRTGSKTPALWRGAVQGYNLLARLKSGQVVEYRDATASASRIDVVTYGVPAASPLPAPVPVPPPAP